MNRKNIPLIKYLPCLFLFAILFIAFKDPASLTVESTAFTPNGLIPSKYSCEGFNISPPLLIKDVPSGAKTLAIIVHDPDANEAGGVTHWVVWNLPVDGNIPENFKDGQQGRNSDHKVGYKGMCPPSGTHHYNFYAYALDTDLSLDSNADGSRLQQAMQGHILAQGVLTGTYTKGQN
jgi:Raf kinase inhibitor-like YbhB/YbcL family protein